MTAERMMRAILDDPCASNWLKDAIRTLAQRDPLDASADVEWLLRVVHAREFEAIATPPRR